LIFLMDMSTTNGHFKAIGCKGWYPYKGVKAEFDEQPVEAGETVYTCQIAFHATRNTEYLGKMRMVSDWFHGKNCIKKSLVDPETGGVLRWDY
jgi:hypothetical protein